MVIVPENKQQEEYVWLVWLGGAVREKAYCYK
jgi:hypothetical protein